MSVSINTPLLHHSSCCYVTPNAHDSVLNRYENEFYKNVLEPLQRPICLRQKWCLWGAVICMENLYERLVWNICMEVLYEIAVCGEREYVEEYCMVS